MAPLPARLASAQRMARRSPIRATGIEAEFGTRYTVDTLQKLVRRSPNRHFIWIMGADNLAQLPSWRHCRDLPRLMPITRYEERLVGQGVVRPCEPRWLP